MRELGRCDHDYPRWGAHTLVYVTTPRARRTGVSHTAGVPPTETHYPDRARRVMGLVRELHGGRDYDPAWGRRMKGEGVIAALIARRFETAVGRLGLRRKDRPLRTDLFRVPRSGPEQLGFAW